MNQQRVICFIDGFNLYHSILRLKAPHLKWVNYWSLASIFIRPKSQKLIDVFYFSAYATWLPEAQKRHVQYVKALATTGVKSVMGKFKPKDKKCPKCAHKWCGHEEKETDVNIALMMLDLAHKDQYDHAFLISNDSDLAPAIRMVRANFPKKLITTIAPPLSIHSNELIQVSPMSSERIKIKVEYLNRCLLPETIYDADGNVIVTRPKEYTPPVSSSIPATSPYYVACDKSKRIL